MTRAAAAALIGSLCIGATACGSRTGAGWPERATPIPTDSIPGMTGRLQSGIETPRRLTIRNERAWQTFWTEATAPDSIGPDSLAPEAPEIDFARRTVLAAALGSQPSGGYAIRIGDVYEGPDAVFVEIVKVEPAIECVAVRETSAPVTAVSIPRITEQVVFIDRSEAITC